MIEYVHLNIFFFQQFSKFAYPVFLAGINQDKPPDLIQVDLFYPCEIKKVGHGMQQEIPEVFLL